MLASRRPHHPPASRRRRRHRPPARSPTGTLLTQGERARRWSRIPAGPQDRDARRRAGRAGAPLQPDHRLRHARHRAPASTCTCTTSRWATSQRDYAFCVADRSRPSSSPSPATFLGIVRADGRVATRNYIGILTSVNCSATVARMIAEHFEGPRWTTTRTWTAWCALTHKTGCGMDTEGEGMRHPAPHARRLCAPRQLLRACWWSAWAARRTRSTPARHAGA